MEGIKFILLIQGYIIFILLFFNYERYNIIKYNIFNFLRK